MHMRARHAGGQQRRLDLVDHRRRPADERIVDGIDRDQHVEEGAHTLGVDAAVEQRHLLLLAREHVVEHEARQEAILEVFQLFLEHHAADTSIAVDQREARTRLAPQQRLGQRQDRRDAAAGGKGHVVPRLTGIDGHGEAAVGRHHVDGVASLERVIGPGRETAAGNLADRHAQFTVVEAGADRVRAAYLLAIDGGAQRQMLAGCERIVGAQIGRQIEAQADRFGRLAPDFGDLQGMKPGGHRSTSLRWV